MYKTLVSCPAHTRHTTRNSPVNEVEFLSESVKDQ